MEPELEAEPDYKEVDTNTQINAQEVEYAIENFVGHEETPENRMQRV